MNSYKTMLTVFLSVFACAYLQAGSLQTGGIINADTAVTVTGVQSQLVATAQDRVFSSASDFQIATNQGGIWITGYVGNGGAVNIPPKIEALAVIYIDGSAFQNNTNITQLIIPDTVTGMGISACDHMDALTSVTLPAHLTTIENMVFDNCHSLISINIPDSVESIGTYAFSSVPFASIRLPAKLTAMGGGLFSNCQNLSSIIIPDTITTIGESAFSSCPSLTSVYFKGPPPTLETEDVFDSSTPTIYHLAGYDFGATFGGRPTAVYGPSLLAANGNGAGLTNLPSTGVSADTVSNIVAAASSANFVVRLTDHKTLAYTFIPTNATYVGDCSGSTLETNAVISVLAGNVNDYVLAWGCTNSVFTTVQGTYINYEFYCREADSGDQQYKLEIYRRDIATDTLSEWGDGGPTFTAPTTATPTIISGSVYVPSIATNSFRIWARLKRMGGTATNLRTLFVGTGVGTPTFFSMNVPASVAIDAHNADVTAHRNIIFPMAYTPIITPSGVNAFTANVTTARSIYDFTASAVNTLTNDLSGIAFNCTTNYQWTVGINYTVTNALSTTWDSRIEWVGLASTTPDLTVTGRYEFAFSTSCGTRIIGRQTYPTIRDPYFSYPIAKNSTSGNLQNRLSALSNATETNAYVTMSGPIGDYVYWFLIEGYYSSGENTSINPKLSLSAYTFFSASTITNDFPANVSLPANTRLFTAKTYMPIVTMATPDPLLIKATISTSSTGAVSNVYITRSKISRFTELELKAYNAGWRP